jgi:pimeloyl-ACP methyl ester carboxylesterase
VCGREASPAIKAVKAVLLKWSLRIGGGLAGVLISFRIWSANHNRELRAESQIAATALGNVEYAMVGEGVPYLQLHGTPGGYDQVLIGRKVSPEEFEGVQSIAVSRPGYLRTPLESGRTFEEQADLYAALLDELGIDKVVVYASSGGGYSGVQFALRHPDRCLALVLYAPAYGYKPFPADGVSGGFSTDLMNWAISGPLLGMLAPSFLDESVELDDTKILTFRLLLRSVIPNADRRAGFENDLRLRADRAVDAWPVEQIEVPTLFLHGDADENTDYASSVELAARMPNARLVTFEGGDHLIVVTRADEVRAEVNAFVDSVLAGN